MFARYLLIAGLAAGLAGCATAPGRDQLAAKAPALTPTQQYPINVTHGPDDILLAVHDNGLSANQTAALKDLVARWRDAGSDSMLIKAPAAGGDSVYRMVTAIQSRLEALGVDPIAIQLIGYDPGQAGPAPVVIGFERYTAVIPQCGRTWGSITHTIDNDVDPNFGCAVSANLAAMVANPQDLTRPAAMTDADAGRREVVLGKYREGQTSSTPKDPQANGAISTVIP